MKKLSSLLAGLLAGYACYAQNTPWSTTTNIGIGTTNPQSPLNVKGSVNSLIRLTPGSDNGEASIHFNTKASESDNTAKWALGPGVYGTGSNFAIGSTVFGGAVATFQTNGNVAIGATDAKGYKLAVAGKLIAEEVNVKLRANWPDYVFNPTYKLPSLTEVKEYIDKNKHLPDMPSEQEVAKEGISLGEMNRILVKKMEEMTLYMIQLKTEVQEQRRSLLAQQAEIDVLNKIRSRKK